MALSLAPAGDTDALARDGGDRSDGGGDRGDNDNGNDNGDDNGGDDHSGHGRDGDDRNDGKKDDRNNDKQEDDDGSLGKSSRKGSGKRTDQERARAAVQEGRVLPLKDILRLVDERRYGTVIAVDLKEYGGRDVYRLKTRDGAGTIRNYRIDARTGKLLNFFGF
ncbi:MAG TPA: PepSY domain-containing protein [Mycoplana sp.]|nr:PepSY domain-containing protein [Mycoplana sp.]